MSDDLKFTGASNPPATADQQNRAGRILFRCPKCKLRKHVPRDDDSDPPTAVECVMYCPDCCAGEGFKTAIVGYYDKDGNEVFLASLKARSAAAGPTLSDTPDGGGAGIARVNLNDHVRFKIRESGEKIWNEHHAKTCEELRIPIPPIPDEMQLHRFMAIFGPAMITASFDPPIETTIEIRSCLDFSPAPIVGDDEAEIQATIDKAGQVWMGMEGMATCAQCGKSIVRDGRLWRHADGKAYRHPCWPAASATEGSDKKANKKG